MEQWKTKAIKLALETDKTYRQIAKELNEELGTNLSRDKVKGFCVKYKGRHNLPRKHSSDPSKLVVNTKASVSFNKGTTTFEDEQEIINGQEITPELIMKAKGLNIEEWVVVSFTKNVWQTQSKDGQKISLCQSKLSVKPKVDVGITFEDIDKYFEKDRKPIDYKPITVDSEESLEIDLADLHQGLLSWRNETGSDTDLNICSEKFLSAIDDIVSRAKTKKFKQIYLCALGDILHIDNDKNETTKGTLQQADGRIAKIFDYAVDTMAQAIDMLLTLNIPIKYMYLCGNHDRNTGYFLVKCLERTFTNNPMVEFDTLPNPQKAIHFGKVLVGLTHGDMPKYNKGTWLMNDYRREFGESDYVEEHCGHIHTEEAKTYNGVMVRSVMAQCGNSYWEHQQGYRSQRGIMSFVWNENKGLRETWYYYY